MQGWTMGLAVIGLMATPATSAGEADEWLTLHVLAVNQADVPDHILKPAEQEGTRLFSAMGIRLLWINTTPASDGSTVATGHHLTINVLPDSLVKRARRATDAMGVAARSHDRRGPVASAFYNRVEAFGRQHGTDVAKILGHVIAHEMGHLLLPHDSHALRGVMRGRFDRAQLEGIANGQLAFTRDQAELIRHTVRATLAGGGRAAAAAGVDSPAMGRVRSHHPRIASLIERAAERSKTFRGLVEAINTSDGIVYVEEGQCGRHGVKSCVAAVTQGAANRILVVKVDIRHADGELMGLIGHELRHAIEILGDPNVVDSVSMYFLYQRIGRLGTYTAFETQAAVQAGHAVRAEVSKYRPPAGGH